MTFETMQNKQRPTRILIVEDNAGDIMMMRRAFKHAKLRHEIMMAASGEEALAMLHREGKYADAQRPDIILLDLNLPKISGRDVLRAIKKDDELKLIPVMILSSSNAEKDVLTSYQLHANSYIVKPSDLQESIAVVEKVEQFWFTLALLPNGSSHAPRAL